MKETVKSYYGLEYVTVTLFYRDSKHGPVISANILKRLEMTITKAIVRQRRPLRGKEVRFIRKSLGLSLESFGSVFELSAPAILKWEKATDKRIGLANELAVRTYVAEVLGVKLHPGFSKLVSRTVLQAPLELKAG